MKKKLASMFMAVAIVATLCLSAVSPTPVLAGEGRDKKPDHPTGIGKEVRLDKHTEVKVLRHNRNQRGQIESIDYEATISILPATTDDGQLIDVRWYEKKDPAGYTYYESGNNLFTALVTPDGRTSLQDSNNRLFVWEPVVSVGTKYLDFGEPEILFEDSANNYYHMNILQWTATLKTGIFGTTTVTVYRQLRIIEGVILEYYIIDGNPGDNFRVVRSIDKELGTEVSLSSAIAFDSSERVQSLGISNYHNGYTVYAKEFGGRTYPVTIDPSSSFTTSSYDGYLQEANVTWATVRDAASGDSTYSSSSANYLLVKGELFISSYFIQRTGIFFSTSALSNDATITSAYIRLYNIAADGTGDVVVQSGAPTYPHSPMIMSDYNRTNYSGDGGSIYLGGVGSGYNNLYLNSTGLSWINKTGTTKFMLRHSNDIDNTVPGQDEGWHFSSYEKGTGYAPKLVVTYTLPVVPPDVDTSYAYDINETSMTLRGYLYDDGEEACVVKFQYGTTIAYGSYSGSASGVTSGSYFNIGITGLTRGQTYHFRAVATNSAGTSYGYDRYAVTLPAAPTSFTATAGDEKNVLAWTKGTGADNTMVRFSTVDYPSYISDGTQAYFNVGTGFDHTSLTEGTTYYYSAWSEVDGKYSTSYVVAHSTPFYLGAPDVETRDTTTIGVSTATVNGYLTALNQVGGTVSCTLQYYYGAGSFVDNETTPDVLSAPGSFGEDIDTLAAATLYYVRAKAVGTNGTDYGETSTFTTGANSAPTMATEAATGTGLTYSTINGKVTADGGLATTVWFIWGLSADSLIRTTSTVSGLYTNDVFYYNLSGLDSDTEYFFQAVGENTEGIGYGSIESVTTDAPTAPSATTNEASDVGANEATLSGLVTSDGGVACEVQFEWDTDTGAPYANSTGWQSGYNTGEYFEALISGLTVGQDYFFRASVKNAHSTTYGSEKTFETVFVAPTNFTAKSVGATTISLTWTKQGDQTYIVYKTTGYPVDRLDGTQVYFGDASSATHDSLNAGVTYFYRAWSWRSGDVWSALYAEDAATTLPVKTSEEQETPDILPSPGEPDDFFIEPSEDKLSNIPGIDSIYAGADTLGMPRAMFLLMISMGLLIVSALVIYLPTGSAVLVAFVIGAEMVGMGWLGIMPGWIAFTFGGLAIVLSSVVQFRGN